MNLSTNFLTAIRDQVHVVQAQRSPSEQALHNARVAEAERIIADIPRMIAHSVVNTKRTYAVLAGVFEESDYHGANTVHPTYARVNSLVLSLNRKPRVELLNETASLVWDYCVANGLEPFFGETYNLKVNRFAGRQANILSGIKADDLKVMLNKLSPASVTAIHC